MIKCKNCKQNSLCKNCNQELLDYLYSEENIDRAIERMKEQDDWPDFVASMKRLAKM